jgi:hypothetical protein
MIGRCGLCGERHPGRVCPAYYAKGRRDPPPDPAPVPRGEFLEIKERGGLVEAVSGLGEPGEAVAGGPGASDVVAEDPAIVPKPKFDRKAYMREYQKNYRKLK